MIREIQSQILKACYGPFRSQILILMAAGLVVFAVDALRIGTVTAPVANAVVHAYFVVGLCTIAGMMSRVMARLADVQASVSLFANMDRSSQSDELWVDGAAANGSLLWFLARALTACRPKTVLELGSGQTTKLFARYRERYPATQVVTLEHDKHFMDVLRPQIVRGGSTHEYVFAPLIDKSFECPGVRHRINTKAYDIPECISSQRYQLVLVDGPDTAPGSSYTREGILEHIPNILDDSFIMVFDDAERLDERALTRSCEAVLRLSKRAFVRFELLGVKTQVVFCSADWAFLRSI